jgi:hypothetical protein
MVFLLAISGVSVLLCKYQIWLILVFLPLNVYLAYRLISELYGPSIYDSLLAEFGSTIVFYCWAVATVLAISPISGIRLTIRKRRMQREKEVAVVP